MVPTPPFPSRHLHTPSFMWFLDHSQMTSLHQYCYSPCLDLDVKLADMFGQMFYSLQTYHGTDKCKVCYFLPRPCSLLVIMIGRSLNHCSFHRQNVRIILTRLYHFSLSSVLFSWHFSMFITKEELSVSLIPRENCGNAVILFFVFIKFKLVFLSALNVVVKYSKIIESIHTHTYLHTPFFYRVWELLKDN